MNFDLILVTNKLIMISKLPNNAFFISISWKMPRSGDQIIIRDFDLMKNEKKFDLMNLTLWKNEFRSHEIRPPDHFPKNLQHKNNFRDCLQLVNIWKYFYSNLNTVVLKHSLLTSCSQIRFEIPRRFHSIADGNWCTLPNGRETF